MHSKKKTVLVLGASGMLGNAVFRVLAASEALHTFGTVRSASVRRFFAPDIQAALLPGLDVCNTDTLTDVLAKVRPDVVINCVGVVKQLLALQNPLDILPVNALFPHRLAQLCALSHARLIHLSTDCVFSGSKGQYAESDIPDASDLYGLSKLLGEVSAGDAITLRTSIIGHELQGNHGLVEWFLSQQQPVDGFVNAIFSGLPTVEMAHVIRDYILPNHELRGLYHLASEPISKHELLNLVRAQYEKAIEIRPCIHPMIDRSLNGNKFFNATGYKPKRWDHLVRSMHEFH
jgi:dTDP-4-dehydrorhamnose reductase